ncbi:NIPSNAP family protein [Aggregicoccus sp. 17bor-14]|uniref:NIPSNAP family protein n=1 Tax=Myxococcaceae TaxID=31 RepID=UPI00129C5AC1|nr:MULTISPECIES: NIPSNAP family protein [Myxococcaceae]MBF5042453.1 NIPSNAP family protein [Simulacricoccus sp. 17bor-14]MRI88224.1 NIPSNAP family protein [Aggregicoccus sp. 17bor-14]
MQALSVLGLLAALGATPHADTCCRVLELRQYTLYPGKRDVLVELFEREFIESQEAEGMRLVGHFRDAGRPERFVWLRGFPDMASRERSLKAFYGGPVWKAHRSEANATMQDSSDVLLLRPLKEDTAFSLPPTPRPPVGTRERPASLVVATVLLLKQPVDAELTQLYAQQVVPALRAAGAAPVAALQTEYAKNTFPALPVREGEHALVWLCRFESLEAYRAFQERLAHSESWSKRVLPALQPRLAKPLQTLQLEPTARSLLR